MNVRAWIFARRARGGTEAPAGRHETGNSPTVTQFCVQGAVDADAPEKLSRSVTHERAHRLHELTGTIASVRVEFPGSGQAPFVRVVGYNREKTSVMWSHTALGVGQGLYGDPYGDFVTSVERDKQLTDEELTCSAHGDIRCRECGRRGGAESESDCNECSTYGAYGWHWDTCANRDSSLLHPETQPIPTPDLSHTLVGHAPASEHQEH